MKSTFSYDVEKIVNAKSIEVDLDKIKLDSYNVRFIHLSERPSEKRVEEILWSEQDTLDLYKQILSAGGVYEDPVLNSEFTVIEGNRRVTCLRRLKQEANEGKLPGISKNHFDKVKCKILPKDTSQQVMDIFLATIHVKGKKPWNAFNKAKHIFNLYNQGGFSYDDLYKKLGMGKATVIRAVEVYGATQRYGNKYKIDKEWFRKFTYFDELYKRKDLKEFRGNPKNIDKFENWVFHKKLDDVREVRQLSKIFNDEEAMSEFEKKDFNAAINIIGSKDPSINSSEFKKIKDTIDVIRSFSRKELSRTIKDTSRLNLLNSLKKEVESLIKDIKSMKKNS